MAYSMTTAMWARIEHELLHGPYRTDSHLAKYLGCRVMDVAAVTRSLWRRSTETDGWSPMDSYRLDQAIIRHRKESRLGPPPVHSMRLPADALDDALDDELAVA